MPRTTLDLDASVLKALKQQQRRTGKTLGALASEHLARSLADAPPDALPLAWNTSAMRARVDLDDKDALFDALEGG